VKLSVVAGFAALALAAAAPASAATPGIVYRNSWSGTRYFHPLASFGNLNRAVTAGQRRRADRLAEALLARGTRKGGTLVWVYRTQRDGPAVWESGLAQAVAAQALARSGHLKAARQAFGAIPNGLLINLSAGPWIKLYSYSDLVVLNAQLQATLSIAEYARLAHDARARRLALSMRRSTLALLPQFDDGYWSRYSLGGAEASLAYHQYVTSLLWKLARRTHGARWRVYASRFRAYRYVAPQIRAGGRSQSFYPVPADGYQDTATVSFWLSKPASVTFRIAGQTWRDWFDRGWQKYELSPRPLPAGFHEVVVSATDRFGNTRWHQLRPVRVLRDTTPPEVTGELAPWQLYYKTGDTESPWVALRLRVSGPEGVEVVKLGRADPAGSTPLAVPIDPDQDAMLIAVDSSGNQTWFPLDTGGAPRLGAEARIPGGYTGVPAAA
jgi:hypothetical protein